jgi:hypothetical protein
MGLSPRKGTVPEPPFGAANANINSVLAHIQEILQEILLKQFRFFGKVRKTD